MVIRLAAPVAACAFLSIAGVAGAASDPLAHLRELTGTFTCTTAEGPPYKETLSHPMGGAALRALDYAANGQPTSEHTAAYDRRTQKLIVFSFDVKGNAGVMQGSGPGAVRSIDPAMQEQLVFEKLSATSYRITVTGREHRKPFKEVDTCAK